MPDKTREVDAKEALEPPKRDSVKLVSHEVITFEDEPKQNTESLLASGISRLKLSKEDKELLAVKLNGLVDSILQARQDGQWDENWDMWEDYYFGVSPDNAMGQANVFIPLTQEIVDTIDAVIEQALFNASPWLQISPREPMDVDVAKKKEAHLDFALQVEMKAKEKLDPIRFDAIALGTGVGHLPWLKETDRIRDEEEYDGLVHSDMERFLQRYPKAQEDFPEVVSKLRKGEKVRIQVEYTEAIHDAPDLEYIPLRDWIVRDRAQWDKLHREVFVGHKIEGLRWDDLLRLEEEGYYEDVDDVRFKFNEKGEREERISFETDTYEIITGIVRWKKPGEARERRYLVDFHPESRTILRFLRYPYWHNRPNYIPFYLQRSRKYIYGISVVQKIEGTQDEVNASHNLLLDSVAFSMPMFKARKGTESIFNPLRDGMRPGKTFYTDNPESDIQSLQVPISSSVQVLGAIEQSANRHGELASGATQNLSGLESSNDPDAPATKTIAQTQQALMRIGKYLAVFGSSLVEFGFQVEELYYQFSPQGRIYRVMGDTGVPVFPKITRQELRLRADYLPHGSTSVLNPEREKRENVQALELLMKIPEVANSPLKRWAAIEIVMDSLGSHWAQKKYKFLPSPEELQLFRKKETLDKIVSDQQLKQAFAQLTAQMQMGNMNGGGNVAGVQRPAFAG